jgi:hemerythrin
MTIHWDEGLVTGIEEIDAEHRLFIQRFKQLSAAIENGEAKELIVDLLAFLADYAQAHFDKEECYMAEYAYPEIEEERLEHHEFTREALKMNKQFLLEGSSRELSIVMIGKLTRWIINHIQKHDRVMAEFLKARISLAPSDPISIRESAPQDVGEFPSIDQPEPPLAGSIG